MFIPFIFRVHGDSDIRKNRFRPHGCNRERAVVYIIQTVFLFHMLNFQIRKRRLMLYAPIHHAIISVHQAIVIQFFERGIHGFDDVRVQREFFTRPITGCAERAELALHVFFIRLREIPNFFPQLFALHAEPRAAFFFQFFLVHHLRFKTSVVCAREPQRFTPSHPMIARHDIFQRHKNRVADMQRTVRIRRRHDDGKRFSFRTWPKKPAFLPCAVNRGFVFFRIVRRRQFAFHDW